MSKAKHFTIDDIKNSHAAKRNPHLFGAPVKVKVAKNVTPDLMEFKKELGIKDDTICLKDNEYYVWVNSYGAVSAILPNGERLGLLPSEFDVTEWHP